MDARLINLRMVLNELGIGPNIETLDQRVTFQKAVYLAQAVGVPLRYKYSWYIRGPYSRDLTRDYYALQEYPDNMTGDAIRQEMREPFASALRRLKSRMDSPEVVPLDQTEWLELLSSVHYLGTVAKLDVPGIKKRLASEKPKLSPYADRAMQSLAELDLT